MSGAIQPPSAPPLGSSGFEAMAARGEGSLAGSYRTVAVGTSGSFWRRFLAFLGPGYLVAVGYMDPGNWATSLAGGSRFGYTLLFAVLLSSLMAIVLQALCARLGIATGRDLAQNCRDAYGRRTSFGLWVLAELAIVATDLAEVIGTAIALKLLFGLPLEWGVFVTAIDVVLILWLQARGFRRLEAFVATMILVIALCFVGQLLLAQPSIAAIFEGLLPSSSIVTDNAQLYLALGILGATVMPHNLYLHTGVVQTRAYGASEGERREAIRFATLDVTLALGFALIVNGAILVLAAASFHDTGHGVVDDLEEAHRLLAPLLGASIAPVLFAIALLASGLSSTVTATLAGQIVMEGFLRLRLSPVVRRLVTRGLAILPAAGVILAYGDRGVNELLVLSQVILSLQLPFAMVPLVHLSASSRRMGTLRAPIWLLVLAVLIAVLIVGLNAKLVFDVLTGAG